jgi:predicted PurR-regulated permease PerM
MIRYLVIISAIILPFLIYYLLARLTKKINKKFPIITLSFVSLLLLICFLVYLRFTSVEPTGLNYAPPKYENDKVVPSKIK